MKLPNLNLNRLFVPANPKFAEASSSDNHVGTTLFSSRSGGGGGDDYGFPDDDETQAHEAPAEPPRSSRGGGGNRGGGTGGRQRTIQFQPEDRYWTEYLRIALPIIGLILMLGLFWYWATNIIGDDETTDPEPTQDIGAVTTIDADPTATEAVTNPTVPVTQEATEPAAEATEEPAAGDGTGAEPTDEPAGEEPTTEPDAQADGSEEPAADTFAPDDTVVINDVDVRMRSEATTDSEIVVTLTEGDELIIVDGPQTADGYDWYEVVSADGESSGFVASDFLDLAP